MMNFLSHLGRTVEIIYMNRNGELSQRKIRVLSIKNGRIRAYCFARKATRYFAVENVLAMRPAKEKRAS
jgi:predicted DNA-binding transcriptional regulator YafY